MANYIEEMEQARARRMDLLKEFGIRCSRGSVAGSIVLYASDAARLVSKLKLLRKIMKATKPAEVQS